VAPACFSSLHALKGRP